MDDRLRASVRRTYRLPGKCLLVLEDSYSGGIEAGETVEIDLPDGVTLRAQVEGVAWGSAFHAENPPLTLIVAWEDAPDPPPGARVRGLTP